MVGIAHVLPKLVVHALLEPAMQFPEPLQIVCREDRPERLLAELSLHELDIVLSDAPASSPAVKVRAFSHLLGECGVTFFGAARYKFLRKGFPQSLDGTPILVPTVAASLRHSLDQWFEKLRIRPIVWGEFDDSALLQIFGQAGLGVFAAPSAIQAQIRRTHGVHVIGRTEDIRERFYAISAERKLQHPAVVAISESAKNKLFS
jgi:LysR family transcriptional activator of nhaA